MLNEPRQVRIPGLLGMAVGTDMVYLQAMHERVNTLRSLDISSLAYHLFAPSFAQIVRYVSDGDAHKAQSMILDGARRLEAAGADFLVITANTISAVAEEILGNIGLPMLGIADVTIAQAKAAGIERLGLISTIHTCRSGLFQRAAKRAGIEIVEPDETDSQAIQDLILRELVQGRVSEEGTLVALSAIDALAQRGAQGVALACTDLTHLRMALAQRAPVPLFDTTTLHAVAAAEVSLNLRRI